MRVKEVVAHVVFFPARNSEERAAVRMKRILDDEVIGLEVEAVENHLVEENAFAGDEDRAGHGQGAARAEVFVEED